MPERTTLVIALGIVLLWHTEPWHGLEIATVSVLGALVLTAPFGGVIAWKQALRAVNWELVIFVGAALVLGKALIETAGWISGHLSAVSGLLGASSALFILLSVTLISLTAHICITSHAARAAVLIPPLLYLGGALGLDPAAVIGTVGLNFGLTLPVSSKAILVLQGEQGAFRAADLLRLSGVLFVAHAGLIVILYYSHWQWLGLAL